MFWFTIKLDFFCNNYNHLYVTDEEQSNLQEAGQCIVNFAKVLTKGSLLDTCK